MVTRNRNKRKKHTGLSASGVEPASDMLVDAELAKGKFSFIYADSFQKEIMVKHCFPLFKARKSCESATRALMKEFDIDESGMVGYSAAGGGLKIVVKIPVEELGLVEEYMLSQGRNQSESASLTFNEEIEWYGIVDGKHTHQALIELENVRPEPFQDFKWVVTVISWEPLSTLKAFSRARNMLQTSHVVQVTLFDSIAGIHEIAQEKARLCGDSVANIIKQRGTIKKIADEFSGGSGYVKETTRTLAGAALRIKPVALDVLGKIMNEEDHDLARRVVEQEMADVPSSNAVFDARAYKNLISTSTVRGATVFLNSDAEDQANALMKLKNAFEDNGFKCFQASRLNKEADRSARARHQIHLMNSLLGREQWPDELADIQRKLLLSSLFDTDLDKHDVSNETIIPSLILEYKQRMPLEAGIRCRLYCREQNINCLPTEQGSQPGQTPDQTQNESTQRQRQSQQLAYMVDTPVEHCPLDSLNLNCFNMSLERYSLNRRGDEEKFDLVTGDPTQLQLNGTCKLPLDENQADKNIAMLKMMLQPHGWIFLYTRAVDFAMWTKVFKGNGFDPLEYPWPMIRDTETVQANTSPIPQNVTEWLIGARRKDLGRPRFQPDTYSNYKRKVSSRKRKFAILNSCPEPRTKMKRPNTREPLRSNQRSTEPMAEFLDTFCPPNGHVLDAFAGTTETAKACYLTKRRCTILEADKLCFDLALGKLKECATIHLIQDNTEMPRSATNSRTCADTYDNSAMVAVEDSDGEEETNDTTYELSSASDVSNCSRL